MSWSNVDPVVVPIFWVVSPPAQLGGCWGFADTQQNRWGGDLEYPNADIPTTDRFSLIIPYFTDSQISIKPTNGDIHLLLLTVSYCSNWIYDWPLSPNMMDKPINPCSGWGHWLVGVITAGHAPTIRLACWRLGVRQCQWRWNIVNHHWLPWFACMNHGQHY